MRIVAVQKARALAMVEIDALNQGGRVRFADCVTPIVAKYQFLKYPKDPSDFDLEKGIHFESGKAGDLTIDALTVYSQAILVDTLSSTTDSRRILSEMLEWGASELGLTYVPEVISRWAYISYLIFDTDFPLLNSISTPLQRLAAKTSAITEEIFGGLAYEPSSIYIGHDPSVRKNSIASFLIQHRANTFFGENRFFSEAPLPTDAHIKFLEEFETDILESLTRT